MTKILKHIKTLFWAMGILAIAASSCSRELDDVFDTPANERVKLLMDSCKNTLVRAPYGWTLSYVTPDGAKSEFIMTFAQPDSVIMYADFTDAFTTTSFSMNYGQGPILSFDTYSPLHTLADPEVVPVGYGHEGDFEFVIMSVTNDSIVLNGRKNKDRVVLRKAFEGYIHKIRCERLMDINSQRPNAFFHILDVNGSKCDVMISTDLKKLKFTTAEGNTVESLMNYTAVGFDLANPFVLNGFTVEHFIWDESSKKFKLDGMFPLDENKLTPLFSVGANANRVIGSLYDVIWCSPYIIGWYEALFGAFPNCMSTEISLNTLTKITTISRTEINGVTTDTRETVSTNMIAFSFLFQKDNAGIAWNNFKGLTITSPREDRILITQADKKGEGEFANDLYLNVSTKKLTTFIFNSTGLTVYIDNKDVYLISTKDSRMWMKLNISNRLEPEQTKYVGF